MPTLRGRPLSKVLSRHDCARVHATCGALAVAHIAVRAVCWLRYGSCCFDATWRTPASLVPHALLAVSSMRFPLPAVRNPAAPMLWPEGRAHSIVFSLRSLALLLMSWHALRAPRSTSAHAALYARGAAVLAAGAAADVATAALGSGGGTVRGMPWPSAFPGWLRAALSRWYSFSQLLASCAFVAYRLDTAFAVLAVVQLAAFAMTLCRKGLLSCAGWHITYAAALGAVFAQHARSAPIRVAGEAAPRAPELWLALPAMALLAAARLRGVSKYRLWAAAWAAHVVAMRIGGTLDVVLP